LGKDRRREKGEGKKRRRETGERRKEKEKRKESLVIGKEDKKRGKRNKEHKWGNSYSLLLFPLS